MVARPLPVGNPSERSLTLYEMGKTALISGQFTSQAALASLAAL